MRISNDQQGCFTAVLLVVLLTTGPLNPSETNQQY
jgi:hypothetical protein